MVKLVRSSVRHHTAAAAAAAAAATAAATSTATPVSATLVITDGDLCILSENFHLPPPRDSPPPPPEILAVPQFVVKRRINVTEVAAVDLSRDPLSRPGATAPLIGCRLSFFDESESLYLAFETGDARDSFIAAVAKVWEEDFGVELEINDAKN